MNSEGSLSAIHTNVMYDYLQIAVHWLYPRYRGARDLQTAVRSSAILSKLLTIFTAVNFHLVSCR